MLRVLHSVSNMARAGIETMLMNYYREIDRSRIQFDFLANKPVPGEYDEEIRSMGGRVFVSPGLNPLYYPRYRQYMANLLHDNPDIKIIHAHNEAMGYYALQSAKNAGIKVRIAHAHNTQIIRDYKYPLKLICKQLLPGAATDYWSCGRDAGIYYYGEERWNASGFIMRNAIDVSKFAFRPEVRERLRQDYGLGNCFVVGHVGRFNMQKNHSRLLDVFSEIVTAVPNSRLVLIGVGELEQVVKEKAQSMGIQDKTLFLGQMADVSEWYQGMDCFVMPSLFEGLPVVGIEAQAAGLQCFFSDRVTDEILLSPGARRIPLQAENAEWAREIITARQSETDRTLGMSIVREAGYDIYEEARKLQEIYLEMADHAYFGSHRLA
ncbi:MAG: glycosyltransferase family 1 protein [Oscillospiraceae bacterium]|nr:glycosyltransferase family 1 protein [Oscillospiraceae bacterium]